LAASVPSEKLGTHSMMASGFIDTTKRSDGILTTIYFHQV
jgi:hypothetical protein